MMAVESELSIVKKLLADVAADSIYNGKEASIACYNGPRSFTIAGSEAAINALGDAVAKMPKTMNTIRVKKLNVTNAFYCAFVDPLIVRLEENARDLTFCELKIPIERATEFSMQGNSRLSSFPSTCGSPSSLTTRCSVSLNVSRVLSSSKLVPLPRSLRWLVKLWRTRARLISKQST